MKSPYVSVSAPNAPATMAAVNRKAVIVPPLIRPETTSDAPSHSTSVIAPKIRKMTIAVIAARTRMRRLAASKVASTASPKRAASRISWVKAWTTLIAPSTSAMIVPMLAMRSWLDRDRSRTCRPRTMIGTITAGMTSSISPVSFGLRNSM